MEMTIGPNFEYPSDSLDLTVWKSGRKTGDARWNRVLDYHHTRIMQILDCLGRGNLGCGAVAVSDSGCDIHRFVAVEWDLCPEEADALNSDPERWIKTHKDQELQRQLSRRGIKVHWASSGNRSVYAYNFFEGINEEATAMVRGILRRLIPGFPTDVGAERNGIRLPLSWHNKTDRYCLLLGTTTRQGTAHRLLKIEPLKLSSSEVISKLGKMLPKAPVIGLIPNKASDPERWVTEAMARVNVPKHSGRSFWRSPSAHTVGDSYLHGWSKGTTRNALFGPRWIEALVQEGSVESAKAALARVAGHGVDAETYNDRLDAIGDLKPPRGWIEHGPERKGEDRRKHSIDIEKVLLGLTQKLLESGRSNQGVKSLLLTAAYCLKMTVQYPKGAVISIVQIMSATALGRRTVIKHRKLLQTEYPLLRSLPVGQGQMYRPRKEAMLFAVNIPCAEELERAVSRLPEARPCA